MTFQFEQEKTMAKNYIQGLMGQNEKIVLVARHIDIGVARGSHRRDNFLSPRRDRIHHRPGSSGRDGARHTRLVQPRLHRHKPTRDPDLRRAKQERRGFLHRKSK